MAAAIVFSIAGDPRRFRTGRQCGSWAGVSPHFLPEFVARF
ncbi:transposase [Acanthopleuribacter pedis]|uniref:Transposase n=1 Tax=Acanthopleuribacter pedis TaxID=442870 RepID=A0A8J7QJ80_9BACT|nr:transposase [Acanthopleuribacter pedis]